MDVWRRARRSQNCSKHAKTRKIQLFANAWRILFQFVCDGVEKRHNLRFAVYTERGQELRKYKLDAPVLKLHLQSECYQSRYCGKIARTSE